MTCSFFAASADLTKLPRKREIPDVLKGSKQRQQYQEALDLLEENRESRLNLDRWINGADTDEEEGAGSSDSDEDEGEVEEQPKAKKARMSA